MFREKSLLLRCMPFMEKGVGSAWGLPVIADGKERLSALSLSEKLEAPGIVSYGADPFRAEHLAEMEGLGIGPLGRYLGGEPIKPVRLGSSDFFGERGPAKNAAGLFCGGPEFPDTFWVAGGAASVLFKSHLEFLRAWGFPGGILIDEALIAPLLAEYITHLHKETDSEKIRIITLVSKQFFDTKLIKYLPNARVSAESSAGEIPVNIGSGNVPLLSGEFTGLGIIFFEELALMPRTQKGRCDILITVNTGTHKNQRSLSPGPEEIVARLKLSINAHSPLKQKNQQGNTRQKPIQDYLFRNCMETLPFPITQKTGAREKYERPGGCSFLVNSKFSGLSINDFKEEQALFYTAPGKKKLLLNREPPPIRPSAPFAALNQTQLEYFFFWRNECRRGYVRVVPDSLYMETYVRLYAEELALCMGKEGPMHHFSELLNLFHECAKYYPETADFLCKFCVDFAVVYEITGEAFPVLLDELNSSSWFSENHSGVAETGELLADLSVCHFFIDSEGGFDPVKFWPLLKSLVPPRALARKGNSAGLPEQFCRTLALLDNQLRRDWKKPFFGFFFPPERQKTDFVAFNNSRFLGATSYTAMRPAFSSHKPLLDILAALALEPEENPLPALKTSIKALSLENELLEELRKESDAVREMLKQEEGPSYTHENPYSRTKHPRLQKTINLIPHQKYERPDKKTFLDFLFSLGEAESETIKNIMHGKAAAAADTQIDTVNEIFFAQFGDILIETGTNSPSISSEYLGILGEWE